MFNLEQSIAEWRKQILAAGIKTPVPLEELECHLHEEIEGQMKSGVCEQLAFETTVSRMGRSWDLKTEFGKDRAWWSFLEFEIIKKEWEQILHIVIWTLILLFFGDMLLLKMGSLSGMTSLERMYGLGAVTLSYLLSCSGFLGRRIFPVIPNKTKRVAIWAANGVLIALWVMIFLLRVNCKMEQFTVEFLWAFMVPMGALSGLSSGLEIAARKKVEAAGS